MIVDADDLEHGASLQAETAVVGAGPAGIATALELARSGVDVLLLESGKTKPSRSIQELGDAAEVDLAAHTPLDEATRRQLGGGSVIWGGRCVPYDPVDFEARSGVHEIRWPVAYDELLPYFQRACDWFVCGDATFDARAIPNLATQTFAPGLPDTEVRTSTLERWSLPTDFGKRYRAHLRRSHRVRTITGLTCVEVVRDAERLAVDHLEMRRLDGRAVKVRARFYVLACGGLGTTRLLMTSDRRSPGGLGNHSGHLGRWYMGHVSGRLARIRFTTSPDQIIYGHERDTEGVYVRRRLSFSDEFLVENQLPNVVFWLANPELGDPSHGSGVLSFAYLALASPFGSRVVSEGIRKSLTRESAEYGVRRHLRNVVEDLPGVAVFAAKFGYRRFVPTRRAPSFIVRSDANVYPLHYHGEQLPNFASRVQMADDVDAVGMRKLRIDLQYLPGDVEGVLRAHECVDAYLRRHERGWLEYQGGNLEERVSDQLGDGCHQIGTTRMSASSGDGVVDRNLAVHGFDDLFVASSSAFPTSSQANPAFMTVVFALRLVDHLRSLLR